MFKLNDLVIDLVTQKESRIVQIKEPDVNGKVEYILEPTDNSNILEWLEEIQIRKKVVNFRLHELVIDKKTNKEAIIVYESKSKDGLEIIYLLEPLDNATDPYWCEIENIAPVNEKADNS